MMKTLLAIHIAGGIAALLSMCIPLLAPKGGRAHRRAGWMFVAGMAIVSSTSLMLAAERFVTNPWLGARTSAVFLGYLGILTGGGVSAGVRVLRYKTRMSPHRHMWDVIVAASIPSLGIALGVYGLIIQAPLLLAFSLVGIFSGGAQLAYWLHSPDHRMHWWFAHMDLMIGSCIAATTAFLVNNSGRLGLGPAGDSLFIWLAPTAIGVPTLVLWTRYYRRRFDARLARRIAPTAAAAATTALLLVINAHRASAQVLAPGGAVTFAERGAAPASQEGRKTFDLASVKRHQSGGAKTNAQVLPNGLDLTNLDLRSIISMAYGIQQRTRLVGAPEWIDTRYDVSARSESPVTLAELRPMLQALLADRFKLKVHTELRSLPAYSLVVARSDGRLGDRLRPSTVECARPAQAAIGNAGSPQAVLCGPRPGGPGKLILTGSPIGQLASLLALMTGRTVIDQTGLAGRYDVDLAYAPESGSSANGVDGSLAPSLFTALEEQLGLRLEARVEPVEVFVIDRIEQLLEN